MPYTQNLEKYIDMNRFINIQERKISLSDIYKLIKFIKLNSINLIHAHGKGAGVISRILKTLVRIPLIYTFHGIHIDCLNIFNRYCYIYYEKIFGWLDNHKIFVSNSEKKYGKSKDVYIGKKYSIINNAVINKKLKKSFNFKEDINKKININNNKRNIISICRLVDQKNIFEIFRIAKKLESYNFIVCGDGELFSENKLFLNENNINNDYFKENIKFIYPYLYASDLFLSTSFYEGHPISVLEAMSIGLPIVLTNVVGNIDTIDHNISGFLYDLGNIDMAANFIEKIMKDKEVYNKFSEESFKKQRKIFSLKKMKEEYLNLYNKYI